MGGELHRGEEQEVLRRILVALDGSASPHGGALGESGDGKQAAVVWVSDHHTGGDLCLVCAQLDHLPLVHFEQEHHNLGVPVLAESELPIELATEVWLPVRLGLLGKHKAFLLLQPSSWQPVCLENALQET